MAIASFNDTAYAVTASEIHWINSAGGLFSESNKWDTHTVPGSSDTAVFDLPGTYTVQLDNDETNQRFRANVAGLNLTFDLNGFDYTADELDIGGHPGDNVSITFEDSSPVVIAASTAAGLGVTQANSSGAAAKVELQRLLKMGTGGSASIGGPFSTPVAIISAGSDVNVLTPRGRLDVTGRLTVGQDGQGFLDVSTGGGLTTNEAILGDGATGKSTAVAVVTDPNSFWRSQSLVIGNRSNASLTVSNKANVDSDQIDIGTHAGVLGRLTLTTRTNCDRFSGRQWSIWKSDSEERRHHRKRHVYYWCVR